jgi:hypothetical protein
MIAGISLLAFTRLHVLISLIGIVSGIVVFSAILRSRWLPVWHQVFIFTTLITSVSGFLFPSASFGPPHVIGVISVMALAVAMFSLYTRRLAGRWMKVYLVSSLFALYLNAFVGVVQAFQKIPILHALAPTQSETPFIAAQMLLLALFVTVGTLTVGRSRSLSAVTA